jgi:hypothetical protein
MGLLKVIEKDVMSGLTLFSMSAGLVDTTTGLP